MSVAKTDAIVIQISRLILRPKKRMETTDWRCVPEADDANALCDPGTRIVVIIPQTVTYKVAADPDPHRRYAEHQRQAGKDCEKVAAHPLILSPAASNDQRRN